MRLYELSDAIRNLEGIEDADQFAAALEDLNLEWDKKIEDLATKIEDIQNVQKAMLKEMGLKIKAEPEAVEEEPLELVGEEEDSEEETDEE